jgi:putative membrane protein
MAARVNGNGQQPNVGAGMVAGIAGGLAGTLAMNYVQAWWSNAFHGYESQSAPGRHDSRDWQERTEEENANELAAQTVADYTIERPLTRDEMKVAATAVHFAFGAAMGAIYGGLMETRILRDGERPGQGSGRAASGDSARAVASGSAFGAAIWLGADEIAMPLLGLSKRKGELPADAHAQSFVAHIAYGVAAELVRRGVRAML